MTEALPPRPWEYLTTARPGEHDGSGHIYIIDANGRKIASIWGPAETKMAIVNLILRAAQ